MNTTKHFTSKAVILVGGKGTRLSSVVSDVPKPLAPIAGKPFLDHLIEDLVQQGIRDVILAVGYMPEKFAGYADRAAEFKLNSLTLSHEDRPLGTGGALALVRPFFKDNETLLVVNGDTFFQGDLNEFLSADMGSRLAQLGVCYVDDLSRFGSVQISENGNVEAFVEKRSGADGFVNAGLYVLSTKVLDLIPPNQFVSLETEIFPQLVAKLQLQAIQLKGGFFDIGIPESYFSFYLDLILQQSTVEYGLGLTHLLLTWLRGGRILMTEEGLLSSEILEVLKDRAFLKTVSVQQALPQVKLLSKDDIFFCDQKTELKEFLKTQAKLVTVGKAKNFDGCISKPLDHGALKFFELLKNIADKVPYCPLRAVPHLFLDRDGIIIDYVPYIKDPQDVRLNSGIVDLIQRAHSRGYRVVMVSNQSGIGREYFSQEQYMKVQNRMLELLAKAGQWIDVCHFAPFQESSKRSAFLFSPSLRKPRAGMILQESAQWNIDLSKSIMIGDHLSDMICGHNGEIANKYLLASDNHGSFEAPEGVSYQVIHSLSEVTFT